MKPPIMRSIRVPLRLWNEALEKGTPDNPCYRARHADAHPPHTWRNGIEVTYNVRCPGYVTPPALGDAP